MYSLLQLVHRNLLLPAFVVPMLCCPVSVPHLGHFLFSVSMGSLYHFTDYQATPTVNKEENLNSKGDLMSTTVYETRSNKMIFNLLTPQGFISLADYGGSGANAEAESKVDVVDMKRKSPSDVKPASNSYVPLGRTVVTANAQSILSDVDISVGLGRHQRGDWGEVSDFDRRANDYTLRHGERILSVYMGVGGEKFWIITEADRSYTTVLMPDDY